MNWGRTKTILIVLFLIVNSLLFTTYILLEHSANSIDDQVIESTVTALSEHGIHISEELIRKKKYADYHVSMKSAASDKENTVKKLLGEKYEQTDNFEYRSGSAVVSISGSKIRYSNNRNVENIEADALSHGTDKLAEEHLKQLGFDRKTYFMYNKHLENGILTFEIMPRYNEFKIEGVRLKAKADNAGILELEGTWFYTEYADTSAKETFCNVTSVLLEFMYQTNSAGKTIYRIEGCLYIPSEYMSAKTVMPLPVYIILCTDGSVTIFNAKDASLILQNP